MERFAGLKASKADDRRAVAAALGKLLRLALLEVAPCTVRIMSILCRAFVILRQWFCANANYHALVRMIAIWPTGKQVSRATILKPSRAVSALRNISGRQQSSP
jgi:hypothetical protein